MSTTTFTIEGRGLKLDSAEQVQEFIATIESMDQLENVILSGNTFGVEACRALSLALAKKPLLKVDNEPYYLALLFRILESYVLTQPHYCFPSTNS
jgi:Ran GTPase-activating protein (RanGAP) involved in mRNA processing and transport